jgi:NAD(P)H-dependent FMN reductase
MAPPQLEITLYQELDQIPPFNPDMESTELEAVTRFRAALRECDVVLISTPEYAHGLPGALKNALDWVVGSGELSGKAVIMVNASSRGVYAQASLREVLTTMDARLLRDAEVTINILGKDLSPERIAASAEYSSALKELLQAIVELGVKTADGQSVAQE